MSVEVKSMEARNIKEAARRLIEQLPENSTWDDLMYEIYVRQAIEAGLADSQAGRGLSVEDVRKRFGLPE
jgi:predicted transcriptional regulator